MQHFKLNSDQFDLLFTGLRYLELHHPTEEYRPEFRELLNDIITQIDQISLFEGMGEQTTHHSKEIGNAAHD